MKRIDEIREQKRSIERSAPGRRTAISQSFHWKVSGGVEGDGKTEMQLEIGARRPSRRSTRISAAVAGRQAVSGRHPADYGSEKLAGAR